MEAEYRKLKSRWLAGERERESALHLMYFAWMHWADPSFVTGLTEDSDAVSIWHETFRWFGGGKSTDVEFLFVGGITASLFSYALGDEHEWAERSTKMKERALNGDTSLQLAVFDEHSDYGKYFAHQLRGQKTRH